MIIVVLRVEEADIVVPGSLKVKCSRCDQDCYEAPSTAKSAPNGQIVCSHCVDGVIAEQANMLHQFVRL